MIRIYLIFAFVLQPVLGFGGLTSEVPRSRNFARQSPTAEAFTTSYANREARGDGTARMTCCAFFVDDDDIDTNMTQSSTRQMAARMADSCRCDMQSVPYDDSVPSPFPFPAPKPMGKRLSEIVSIVPIRALGSGEITFMLNSNLRFGSPRGDTALLADLSAIEAHAVLCVWQT